MSQNDSSQAQTQKRRRKINGKVEKMEERERPSRPPLSEVDIEGHYPDGSPFPAPPPLSIVRIAPEEMPWKQHRALYTPTAHDFFVKELAKCTRAYRDPGATFWAVQPVRMVESRTPSCGPTFYPMQLGFGRPVRGAAYFSSQSMAVAYLLQLELGWEAWSALNDMSFTVDNMRFALTGPWTKAEQIAAWVSNDHLRDSPSGHTPNPWLSKKEVPVTRVMTPQAREEAEVAERTRGALGPPLPIFTTRLNQLRESLSTIKEVAGSSGYEKMTHDHLTDLDRFPHWWLEPHNVPESATTIPEPEDGDYARDLPWLPHPVVPWVEFVNKDKKGDVLIQPTPGALGLFEHEGLAADFARAMCYAVGHMAGRKPEPYEQPYMMHAFHVYKDVSLRNMYGVGKFPAFAKTRPPYMTAGLTHAGVNVGVSDTGHTSDQTPTPLTRETAARVIRGFVDSASKEMTVEDFLDVPPTPNTAGQMAADESSWQDVYSEFEQPMSN